MHEVSDSLYIEFVEHGFIRIIGPGPTGVSGYKAVTIEINLPDAKKIEELIGKHVVIETSYKVVE